MLVSFWRACAKLLLLGGGCSRRDSGHGRVCTRLWEFAFSEAGCAIYARLLVRLCRFGVERSKPRRADEHGGCGGTAPPPPNSRGSPPLCLWPVFFFRPLRLRFRRGK